MPYPELNRKGRPVSVWVKRGEAVERSGRVRGNAIASCAFLGRKHAVEGQIKIVAIALSASNTSLTRGCPTIVGTALAAKKKRGRLNGAEDILRPAFCPVPGAVSFQDSAPSVGGVWTTE